MPGPDPSGEAILTRSLLIYNDTNRNLQSWMSKSLGGRSSTSNGTSRSRNTVSNQASEHDAKTGQTGLEAKEEGEDEEETEDEFFVGDGEENGLGYTAPKPILPQYPGSLLGSAAAAAAVDRQLLSNNDALRRQLLGNKARATNNISNISRFRTDRLAASTPRPMSATATSKMNGRYSRGNHRNDSADDDDDNEGRANVVGKKFASSATATIAAGSQSKQAGDEDGDDEDKAASTPIPSISSTPLAKKKRNAPVSFLDEALAKRQKKKEKEKQKQKQEGNG